MIAVVPASSVDVVIRRWRFPLGIKCVRKNTTECLGSQKATSPAICEVAGYERY